MNVSKGQGAKVDDLKAAFGTDDQKKICLEVCSPVFTLTFKQIDIEHTVLWKCIEGLSSL